MRVNDDGVFSRHEISTNLYVVPYIRGRLAFAQIVAGIMQEIPFDLVLLDLPRFMQHNQWLEGPLSLFPLVSSFLIKGSQPDSVLFPFVPTDAACVAAYLAGRGSVALRCVDESSMIDCPAERLLRPDTKVRDDCAALAEGVDAFFGSAWARMDELWRAAETGLRELTIARAAAVARRVQEGLSGGRKVLFVCEYGLWWAVRRVLADPNRTDRFSPDERDGQDRLGALLLEDPLQLWAAGHFDDYPALNQEFFTRICEGRLDSFDKAAVLEEVIARYCASAGDAPRQGQGLDQLLSLKNGLWVNGQSRVRSLPLPGSELLNLARTFIGSDFANGLAKAILCYPVPTAEQAGASPPEFFKIAPETILPHERGFALPDVFHTRHGHGMRGPEGAWLFPDEERLSRPGWANIARPFITRQEARELKSIPAGIRWAVKLDYLTHAAACALVRGMVRQSDPDARTGDDLDEFTPTVFLFTSDTPENVLHDTVHDSNPAQRYIELQDPSFASADSAPDAVYSLFSTYTGAEWILSHHLERERLTSLSLLYSGASMGPERYAAINSHPKRYQCRQPPESDPALNGFSPSELGIAWAVRYARKRVLAVVPPAWQPSAALQEFARRHRKTIKILPLDCLPPEMLRKLKYLHFTSTSLKRHPMGEAIVARYLF